MNSIRKKYLLLVFTTLFAISSLYICNADQSDRLDNYRIVAADNSKEGIMNEFDEWVVPPIYDTITYDGYSYWVFFRTWQEAPELMGVINFVQGFAIPVCYEDILIGDDLIVAYSSLNSVYDIYDMNGKLISALSGEIEYVTPVDANTLELIDQDLDITHVTVKKFWGTSK